MLQRTGRRRRCARVRHPGFAEENRFVRFATKRFFHGPQHPIVVLAGRRIRASALAALRTSRSQRIRFSGT